ncbi:low-affinity phosphate transporter [Ascosphaera pollenicola]|nr:low-affinity phosphate transporter [Ascosphaera pollenicola]
MVLSDPTNVNLETAEAVDVICYFNKSLNGYNGNMGLRIVAIFVIGFVSTVFTFFPVVASRLPWLRIPFRYYLYARFMGTGVILATAFIHLMDPAYESIGPKTCIGLSSGWDSYSWCSAIILCSCIFVFLLDFSAELYVEHKYGVHKDEDAATHFMAKQDNVPMVEGVAHTQAHKGGHCTPLQEDIETGNLQFAKPLQYANDEQNQENTDEQNQENSDKPWQLTMGEAALAQETTARAERSFRQQIAAFLILEFGIIFHSIIIGLNLGVSGHEFYTLFPVLVFHQSFEGLGIGARMSAIPFRQYRWLPWALCSAYGLTTPISIAIGLGVRNTYEPGSKTSLTVQGVLDAISAGILVYTALVELLARDFMFDPNRTKDKKRLAEMLISTFVGVIIMAVIGKWA